MTNAANLQTTRGRQNSINGFRPSSGAITRRLHEQVIDNDEAIWKKFLVSHPIMSLLRPDFFLIYKHSKSTILHQQNINLDLGTTEVTYEKIMHHLNSADRQHFQVIDSIMSQMMKERKLQPLDYIFRICANVECPNTEMRGIMRTSFLIHCDAAGDPDLGFICFNDVTSMVSSVRPHNYEINFNPGFDHLTREINEKVRVTSETQTEITHREKEVLACIHKGMSSKEIASKLFISKATVDTHRQNMLRKWDLPNSAALLRLGKENGWI